MDTKIDKTPRQLAHEYYKGMLTFTEYREQRAHLIDDITSDEQTRPLQKPAQAGISRETELREPPPAAQTTSGSRSGIRLLSIIGLAVAGAVIGWLMVSGDGGRPVDDEPAIQTTEVDLPEVMGSNATFLEEFLAVSDWSQEALAGLMLAWTTLREQEQQAVRRSESFRVFSERLRERVLEQRALRDIDSDAVKREQVLLSLAEHLDVPGLVFAPAPSAVTDGQPASEPAVQARAGPTSVPAPEPVPEQRSVVAPEAPDEQPVVALPPDPVPDVKQNTQHPAAPISVTTRERLPEQQTAAGFAGDDASGDKVAKRPASRAEAAVPVAPVRDAETRAQPAVTDACPASLARTRKPYCSDTLRDGGKGPLMVVLPAGSFRMGSGREASEGPIHEVTLSRPYAISVYEVSVAEYARFCKASSRHCVFPWKGESDPVVNVSWKDAVSFTNWLSSATGMSYRLPTEAEWEYAARGGTTGEYPFGDGSKVLPSDARFDAAAPLPVDDRSVNANGFRLRHIVGNVREWVADAWFDNYQSVPGDGRARTSAAIPLRVVRGGSFVDSAYQLRSSARGKLAADTRDNRTGFRLVREIKN